MPKMELSEEYKEELDRKLKQVQKNDMITVVYYEKNEYLKKTGMVSRIEMCIRDSVKYPRSDVYSPYWHFSIN